MAETVEDLLRDNVNTAMQHDARKNFSQTIKGINTSYSHALQKQEDAVNASRKKSNPYAVKVTFLDLDKFVAGLSYGMQEDDIVDALLGGDRLHPDDKRSAIAKNGKNGYTFDARYATPEKVKSVDFRYIVPALDYALNRFGLTATQNSTRTNKHESYHAIDEKFIPKRLALGEGSIYKPVYTDLMNNPTYAAAVALTVQSEYFADCGAIGDMIREGEDLSILDKTIAWRETMTDFGHQTAPGLQALKNKIVGIGLEKFRALNQEEAIQIYYDVAEKTGPTPRQMRLAGMVCRENDPDDGRVFLPDGEKEADVAKAREWARRLMPNKKQGEQIDYEISWPADQRAVEAKHELVCRAFAKGGVVTPETMVQGFLDALEERRAQKQQGGKEDELNVEMTELQNALVGKTDYVAENSKRGVRLVFSDSHEPMFIKVSESPEPQHAKQPSRLASQVGSQV